MENPGENGSAHACSSMKLEDEAMPVRWRTGTCPSAGPYCAADSKPMILATALGRITGLFVNAVLYVLQTGISWEDLPTRFGNPNTVWKRFVRWCAAGVCGGGVGANCSRIGRCRPGRGSTRCHEHYGSSHSLNRSTPGKRKKEDADQRRCLGRSRGGLTTK